MSNRFRIACLLPLAAATVGLATPEPSGPPLFEGAASDLVVLAATVTDPDGGFVDGLAAEHFAVYDDNRPQPIALFSHEDTPVSVGLIIDNSSSMRPKM